MHISNIILISKILYLIIAGIIIPNANILSQTASKCKTFRSIAVIIRMPYQIPSLPFDEKVSVIRAQSGARERQKRTHKKAAASSDFGVVCDNFSASVIRSSLTTPA